MEIKITVREKLGQLEAELRKLRQDHWRLRSIAAREKRETEIYQLQKRIKKLSIEDPDAIIREEKRVPKTVRKPKPKPKPRPGY